MITVNVHEAKTNLSKLLERVAKGERVIIAKAGTPVAVIEPYATGGRKLLYGMDKGRVLIGDDWDDPIPGFEDYE